MRRHTSSFTSLFLVVSALGCSIAPASPDDSTAQGATAEANDTDALAGAAPACAGLAAGAPGTAAPLADFARAAHAHRFWGPGVDPAPSETALAKALATSSSVTRAMLASFAMGLDGACALRAEARPLGPASVSLRGSVAIVRPGTGDVMIPDGVTAAAIDLRQLPQTSELMPALERAFAALSHASVSLADEHARECNGQPDEVFSVGSGTQNAYGCIEGKAEGRALAANGARDLPLAVLTGAKLAPDAARFALGLRARGRAWLVGRDVSAAVAESTWYGVGDAGLAVRTRSLFVADKKLPDVARADVRSGNPAAAWSAQPRQDAPPALDGTATRADFAPRPLPTAWRGATDGPGEGRAALALAYATIRSFWPYLEELSAPVDPRFLEAMGQLDADIASGRPAIKHALGRMSEALSDGHSLVYDFGEQARSAFAPVALVPVGGDIVVAVSATPLVSPGEVVLAVDGKPISTVLARVEEVTSCSPHEKTTFATESYRLFRDNPSPTLHVRGLDGAERDVTVAGTSTYVDSFGMWDRAPGPLTDLGAPDVFYVSLNAYGKYPPHTDDMAAIDRGLAAARAVVLDMRGYPGDEEAWSILGKVVPGAATGPALATFDETANSTQVVDLPVQSLSQFGGASAPIFSGPVVLLVGKNTQSSAEHLTSFFKSSKRGKVLGETTSGANGNITGVQLPGGFGITFTGMHVAHPDGSRFFGIGHIPDVLVAPTAADFHDGRDVVLKTAIDVLAAH